MYSRTGTRHNLRKRTAERVTLTQTIVVKRQGPWAAAVCMAVACGFWPQWSAAQTSAPSTQPAGVGAATQPAPGKTGGDLPEGDELLLFQDMPVVISAARRPQPANWLSVPVSIFTAEDIHHSGLTTVPELLQFSPGVDLLQLDRNFWAAGVRGFHGRWSNRLLSLVDGHLADSPIYGGPEFARLPLFLEDIKRIEVVRGPGGAAWGANAFSGVINIITKDPEETQGCLASTTWNHFGDSYSQARWGSKAGKWSWRFSAGYEDRKSSEDAIEGDPVRSHDFSRTYRLDSKAVFRASPDTRVSTGIGYSHIDAGNYDSGAGYYVRELRRFDTGRAFVRIDRRQRDGTGGHLQWFGNFASTKYPEAVKSFASENDLEVQYDFHIAKDHTTSVGGNFRWTYIDAEVQGGDTAYTFRGMPVCEYLGGAFFIDRWQVTDRLVLEGQLRGDWYSQTHVDWSGRGTALYALDRAKRRIVRLSAAKAFRTPLLTTRMGQKHAGLMFPGTYFFNIVPPVDLKNEETWALEAGFRDQITDWLAFRSDVYYQRYDRLIGDTQLPDPLGMGRTLLMLDNGRGAHSYGAEVELAAKSKAGKLSAWYACNKLEPDGGGNQQIEAYLPAVHKAGATGRLFLPHDLTVNANYRYMSSTSGKHADLSGLTSPGASHRLDLTLSKQVAKGAGEVMIGVADVFNRTNDPVGQLTTHETPGRTFFMRFQVKF